MRTPASRPCALRWVTCSTTPTRRSSTRYGESVARLVDGLRRLNGLRVITRMTTTASAPEIRAQSEVLRKMLLAMVEDIRVVLLRWPRAPRPCATSPTCRASPRVQVARESLDIYAPLANRLGIWQLKWELEDLSFRFIEPETYKRIARRCSTSAGSSASSSSVDAVERLKSELAAIGVDGRDHRPPKHIYSIYNKMRAKRLDFSQIFDVRACACWCPR
jgi:GTP pyrophosphokinase